MSVETSNELVDRRISVAPMMDWTDRHCRYFLRGFSPRMLLYTEMITAEAVLRGDAQRLLRYDAAEHPLALQLGGSEPGRLAEAARRGAGAGYDEINLNCGCPSDRVHAGAFGACLMAEPQRVAECVAAMCAVVPLPVTVKLRIGIVTGRGAVARERSQQFDDADWEALCGFVAAIAAAGCASIIVHARKAVLGGMTPEENREVPPLRYDVVQRLKRQFGALQVVLNGGLRTPTQVGEALQWCDGVMLGREAYHRPRVLSELHRAIYADDWVAPDESEQLARMVRYAERELARGERLAPIVRHMLGLYAGRPGAREFRRYVSEGARDPSARASLLLDAAERAAAMGACVVR